MEVGKTEKKVQLKLRIIFLTTLLTLTCNWANSDIARADILLESWSCFEDRNQVDTFKLKAEIYLTNDRIIFGTISSGSDIDTLFELVGQERRWIYSAPDDVKKRFALIIDIFTYGFLYNNNAGSSPLECELIYVKQ